MGIVAAEKIEVENLTSATFST